MPNALRQRWFRERQQALHNADVTAAGNVITGKDDDK